MSEYFPDVPKIQYEGSDSKNPLAFKHYNADEEVEGKTMRDHFRFGAAYWHCMRNPLGDPFGVGTALMPWDDGSESLDNALARVPVFFEFLEKAQIDFYCFHDRDVSPEGATWAETHSNLERVTQELKGAQDGSGKKLLWGTACLFAHPRYAQGAATSRFDALAVARWNLEPSSSCTTSGAPLPPDASEAAAGTPRITSSRYTSVSARPPVCAT